MIRPLAWLRRQRGRPPLAWAAGLGFFGVLERLVLYRVYAPISYGDSPSYLRLAGSLADFSLSGYDGTRVPGYPLLMMLMGAEPVRIWLAQMALGLAISLLLFWLGLQTTRNPAIGAVLGLLYDVLPGQFLFEANLLTETFAAFWILLSLCLLHAVLGIGRRPASSVLLAFLLGIAASAAGMVRPLFFPLTVFYLPFLLFAPGRTWRARWQAVVPFILGPLLIQGGWLAYMRSAYHVVSPTAMAGYSMVQHTGEFFEYLPDEYAPIRDTYLRFRDEQIAARGVQTNAIWGAIPEISKASGLGFYDLAREMQRLSWMLIRAHPLLYLRNVVEGWIWFWKAPVYWRPEMLAVPWLRSVLAAMAILGRGLSLLANLAFLIVSAAVVVSRKVRAWVRIDAMLLASFGMVWLFSILQTLLDHGDNPRFLVPLQMVVFFAIVHALTGGFGLRGEGGRP